MNENTEFKLGLSATAAETIRDFLRDDVKTLKRELAYLARQVEGVSASITRLSEQVEGFTEEVTLDLLDSLIEGNADTTVVRKGDDNA